MSDLQGALILLAGFGALLAVAEIWARRKRPPPELPRKLVHLGGAFLCLFFPVLVRSPWIIGGMALAFSLFFELGRRLNLLQCLHRIKRSSRGSEYYPLAIWMLCLLAGDDLWRYISSVLVLGIADTAAALIGSRFGKHRYRVEDEWKSLEGSLAFLALAFLAIIIPAGLMTDLPPGILFGSALLVSILVTGFESFSLRGTDNIFVPIAACVILGKITTKPMEEILYQNLSLVVMITGAALLIWQTRWLHISGGVALVWVAYGAWSLGSEWWALPILSGIPVYIAIRLWRAPGGRPPGRINTIIRPALVPLLVLMIDNQHFAHEEGLPVFLAVCAFVAAFVFLQPTGDETRSPGLLLRIAVSGVALGLTLAPPWVFGRILSGEAAAALAAAIAGTVVLLALPFSTAWSARHMLLSFLVAAGAAAGLFFA